MNEQLIYQIIEQYAEHTNLKIEFGYFLKPVPTSPHMRKDYLNLIEFISNN